MQRAALIAIGVLLTGCATTGSHPQPKPGPPDAAALAAHGVQCHEERATGSLIAATVCTTPAGRARATENAQQTKDWLNNAKAGPCAPTGPCN